MKAKVLKHCVVLILTAGSTLSGWQGKAKLNDSHFHSLIDRAVSEIRVGAYDKGMMTITGSRMEARSRFGPGDIRDLLGEPKPPPDRVQILQMLSELKRNFDQKNDLLALQVCSQLGLSLAALSSGANPLQDLESPTGMTQAAS